MSQAIYIIGNVLSIMVLLLIWSIIKNAYIKLDYKEKRHVEQLAIKVGFLYFSPVVILIYLIFNYRNTILIPLTVGLTCLVQIIICPIYLYMELKKLDVKDDFYYAAIGCMWIMILYTVIRNLIDIIRLFYNA